MSDDANVILIVDEPYMANLLTEELCGDGSPLSDLSVKRVSQTGGLFRVEMALKKDEAA